jgi:LppP/LprE lipoprotein
MTVVRRLLVCVVAVAALTGSGSAAVAAPVPATAPAPSAVPASIAVPAPTPPTPAPPTGPTGPLSLGQAEALVLAHRYTAITTGSYNPKSELSVLVGRWTAAVDGHPEAAFLFHRGRFVGVDSRLPSATVRWEWSTGDTVTLEYELYHPDDPLCCPSAGAAAVRYHWMGTKIVRLDALPSTDWSAAESRR